MYGQEKPRTFLLYVLGHFYSVAFNPFSTNVLTLMFSGGTEVEHSLKNGLGALFNY